MNTRSIDSICSCTRTSDKSLPFFPVDDDKSFACAEDRQTGPYFHFLTSFTMSWTLNRRCGLKEQHARFVAYASILGSSAHHPQPAGQSAWPAFCDVIITSRWDVGRRRTTGQLKRILFGGIVEPRTRLVVVYTCPSVKQTRTVGIASVVGRAVIPPRSSTRTE